MKAPSVWALRMLMLYCNKGELQVEYAKGKWGPARPMGFFGLRNRLRCAWLAFTGRGDVVVWPEDKG